MFSAFIRGSKALREGFSHAGRSRKAALFLLGICVCVCRCETRGAERDSSTSIITNVAQFRYAPPEIFLGRCSFRLSGIVTLVDTNRGLLVLQDETGAVALNPTAGLQTLAIQVGQRAVMEGPRCFPSVVGFPKYPYQSSGWEIRTSFEEPEDFGYYYLSRIRAHLHPPVSGDYTFWIASDNSSELWLSSDDDPTKVKKIAFLQRYTWVAQREWSRYPSQRSESIPLKAGRDYYIEAFHEQTTGGDHLAVAWQGPSLKQAVIAERYLTPWPQIATRYRW